MTASPNQLLAGKKNLLIVTHKNADLDSFGSAVIVSESHPGKIVCPGGPSRAAAEAAGKLGVPLLEEIPSGEEFDCTIVVDTCDPSQIEPLEASLLPRPLIVFDHHEQKAGGLHEKADAAAVAPGPSCVEVVLNSIPALTRRARLAAICGIYADTRHLAIAPVSTLRKIIELSLGDEALLEEGRNLSSARADFSQRVATLKALAGSKFERIPNEELLVAWAVAGSFESNVANSLISSGADVALVATAKDSELRISGRASNRLRERMHLGQIFQKVGGGGHPGAALVNHPVRKASDSEIAGRISELVRLIKEILVG